MVVTKALFWTDLVTVFCLFVTHFAQSDYDHFSYDHLYAAPNRALAPESRLETPSPPASERCARNIFAGGYYIHIYIYNVYCVYIYIYMVYLSISLSLSMCVYIYTHTCMPRRQTAASGSARRRLPSDWISCVTPPHICVYLSPSLYVYIYIYIYISFSLSLYIYIYNIDLFIYLCTHIHTYY